MRSLTFKTKIWIFVTTFSSFLLILAFSCLAVVYYLFSLNSFKTDLVNSTQEIFQNHLVFDNNQIFFKRDSNNRTISAYLRDKNMSAIFFDNNLDSFAEYGVYQKLADDNKIDTIVEQSGLKEVYKNNSPRFSDIRFYPEEEYFVLTTPVLFKNNKVGVVQIAMFTPFFSQIKAMGFYLLLIILVFCVLASWPLSHLLVNYLLKPLDNLIESMERARVTNLNMPINYSELPQDEISILVASYNKMIGRISEGFERQKAFISQASHELKAPLARAISSLDVILLRNRDKDLELVRDDLFYFSRLIDELLVLSKLDSGTVKIGKNDVVVEKVLAEAIKTYSGDVETKKLKIDIKCQSNLKITTDLEHFKLLFFNLFSNAIKYSRNNGRIYIEFEVNEGSVRFKIQDFGVGISQPDLLKIFDRFFRSSQVVQTPGFGIGLALVKQICSLHHYDIKYDSRLGLGTTVTVSGISQS